MTKEDIQNSFFNQLELLNLPSIQRRFIAYKLADLGNKEIVKAQLIDNTLSIECEANKSSITFGIASNKVLYFKVFL